MAIENQSVISGHSFILLFFNSIICRSTKKDNIKAVARPATESLTFTSAVQSEKLSKKFLC